MVGSNTFSVGCWVACNDVERPERKINNNKYLNSSE
jgi:hypothetical protein